MVISRALVALTVVPLALGLVGGSTAMGATDQQRGAEILDSVESGELKCDALGAPDLEAVGEFVMGRMLGSPSAHEGMDQMMASMMGERGLDRMHEFMGRRFAGCRGGPLPAGATDMMGAMMGMMGMMGGPRGSDGFGSGMMGGGDNAMLGSGRSAFQVEDDDDWGGAETAMVVMMAALLALAIAAVVYLRPGRRAGASGSPREILDRRYAHGELDSEEYSRQRKALGDNA